MKLPKLNRFRMAFCLSMFAAVISQQALAQTASCSYSITNEWNSGLTGSITITNTSNAAINGWSVNWQYTTNRISSSWNANLAGSNPYTATNLAWNGAIQPGQSINFGFQVNKNGGAAEKPTINGSVCGGIGASSSSSPASSSAAISSIAPSSSSLASSKSSAVVTSAASSISSAVNTAINLALTATASTSYVSSWETLAAVNDNSQPANSNDKSKGAYGNWNNPNSYQWVEYQWATPVTISSTEVYWFDDAGGVLTPTSAVLE